MKMKLYIIMLFCLMVGMYSCYDDDTTSGRKEVSLLTITAAHDTLTTSFGEELVVNHLKIEQSGEELPLTYEWAYGDLDISIIDELPAMRLPIKNCVVGTSYRPKAYSFIERQVREGRQAYVICPMVEESEGADGENVTDYTARLREIFPSDITIGMLHGKMKPKEKNGIMEQFARGEIQVLVSTTVVEVGVNVPNATVMMVENAERFGLAQLHQLRGRVGRGAYQSYCIFMQGNEEEETSRRLEILNKSNDGFFIAGEDLKLRGPGDLFGIRQSGQLEFRIGDIYQDSDVLKAASDAAGGILELDRELDLPQHEKLKERLNAYMKYDLENLGL